VTTDRELRRWELAGLVALAVIVLVVPLVALRHQAISDDTGEAAPVTFSGTASCVDCHPGETNAWRGSDHDLAMAEATEETVLGDFDDVTVEFHGVEWRFFRRDGGYWVATEGPGGEPGEFEVRYTFGHEPLQQYLVPFPGGRLQAMSAAWDSERGEWYHLYPNADIPPDDWLHWTRNGQNWNGMCAECHSTNLVKAYDPETDAYDTTWTDIDVGCEACHGPGSAHVAWAEMPAMARPDLPLAGLVVNTRDLTGAELVERCAPCHSRRAELGDDDHTNERLLDVYLPSLLRDGLYHADGQILDEVYVYGSFLQSKMYARGVTCRDCHDSHSLKLHAEGNALCLQCHEAEVYDTRDHHFHKKTVDGEPSDGALCVKCHMVESPYMVIDWRADHSFRVPRPDLTADIGTPNACGQANCHADKPLSWMLEATRRWYGEARRPHFGTAFAAAREGDPAAVPELARLADNTLQPPLVRASALDLLAQFPGEAPRSALEAGLTSEHGLIRHTAAARLNERDPQRLVELLAPLLADPVNAVRFAAVSALAGVPEELLEPYQREALALGITDYREAMAHSLDFASSGLNLGNLEVALGDAAAAERYYRTALQVDDLFLPAAMNLATVLAGRQRLDEAEQLLQRMAEAYPENADPAASLGLLLAERGRMEEAADQLLRAATLRPNAARLHFNLGLVLQHLGRLEQATVPLSRAAELAPDDPSTLHALADNLARRGRLEEARAVVQDLIEEHPDYPAGPAMLQALGG
jgi:tetratricopeptide (TPR) repeat protein